MRLFCKGGSPGMARLCLLFTALLWSTGGLLIKLVAWNPFVTSSLRSLIAAITIWLYRGRIKIIFNKRTILGGLFIALTLTLFVLANKLTTAANAIMLQYTSPIFTILITAFFFRKKVARTDILIVIMTTLGISLFFMDKLSAGGMLGNLLAVASGFTFSCIYIFSATNGDVALDGILIGQIFSFLMGLPFVFIYPPVLNMPNILAILALGIFQIGLAYIIFGEAMQFSNPFEASIITMAEPLLNPVWVLLATGEAPGLLAVAGGVIVIAAMILKTYFSKKASKNAPLPLL